MLMSSLLKSYKGQQANAKCRGIAWEFTFQTWIETWGEKIDQRGAGREDLCMCRKHDLGPYSPANVYIATNSANSHDQRLGKLYKSKPAKPARNCRSFSHNPSKLSAGSVGMAMDPLRSLLDAENPQLDEDS